MTDFPKVSGQLIGYTMAVAYVGGPENWQLLNKTFDAYRTQVLDNKQNLGFGNLLAAAFTAPLVKNVLSSAQNNTDGLIITGLNHGKTIQEIFEPFKKLANMSATRNMTSD